MDAFIKKTWESNFFNKNIFHVNLKEIKESVVWPENALLSSKIDSGNYLELDIASKFQFEFCEGEISFSRKITQSKKKLSEESIANEGSIEELKSITEDLYINSRFREPWFSVEEKNIFYKKWVENAVLSLFDDVCLIFKENNKVLGFVTLKTQNEKTSISLIGVANHAQGKGIGSELLSLAYNYTCSIGSDEIIVSTQTSNTHAANLYIRNNFLLTNSSLWFYKKV